MTALPTGGQPLVPRRRLGFRDRRFNDAPGLTELPRVYGLVAPPPDLQTARNLQRLGALVPEAGGAAIAAGAYLQQQQALEDRRKNEIRAIEEGQAVLDAQTLLPELQKDIADLNLVVPDTDPDGNEITVTQFVEEELDRRTDGFSDAYRRRFKTFLQPRLVQAFTEQQSEIKADTDAEFAARLRERLIGASDQDLFTDTLKQSRSLFPNMQETERLDLFIVPALKHAASTGDQEAFTAARQALGNRFPGLQTELQNELNRTKRTLNAQAQAQANDRLSQRVFAALNDDDPNFDAIRDVLKENTEGAAADDIFRLTQLVESQEYEQRNGQATERIFELFNNDRSLEDIEATVKEETKAGNLTQQQADQFNRRIDAEREAQIRAQQVLIDQVDEQKQLSTIQDNTILWMRNARTTGGAATIQLPDEITLPSGKMVSLSDDAIIGSAIESEMQRIGLDDTLNSQQKIARQAEFLSRNGVTYEPYERIMAAGHMSIVTDIQNSETPEELPANLINGYELYKQMGRANPTLRNAHTTDDVRNFYRLAETAERYITPGDPNAALFQAIVASGRPGGLTSQINSADIDREVRKVTKEGGWGWPVRFGQRTARNIGTLRAEMRNTAAAYIQIMGLDPKAAAEAARKRIEEDFTIINGWAIDTADRSIPPNIDQVSDRIAEQFIEQHGDDQGDRNDLILVPGANQGTWFLSSISNDGVFPVEPIQLFTNGQLIEMSQTLGEQERNTAIESALNTQIILNERLSREHRRKITDGLGLDDPPKNWQDTYNQYFKSPGTQ